MQNRYCNRVYDYSLGFGQNIKNPITISLLFGVLRFSCRL